MNRAHCNDYSAAFTRIRDAVDALPVDDAVIDTAIAGNGGCLPSNQSAS